jgi:tetratricopeptide (TPR) repeat protein
MKKNYLFLAFMFLLLFLCVVFFKPLKLFVSFYIYGEEKLEKKLVDMPDDPLLNCKAGGHYYGRKKFGKAKACFKKAAKNLEDDKHQIKSLAYASAANSSLRIAEILIDKKAKNQEAKPKAVEVLGEAIADYQRSLDLVPLNEKVLANKAVAENLLKSLQHKSDGDSGDDRNSGGEESKQGNGQPDNKAAAGQQDEQQNSKSDAGSGQKPGPSGETPEGGRGSQGEGVTSENQGAGESQEAGKTPSTQKNDAPLNKDSDKPSGGAEHKDKEGAADKTTSGIDSPSPENRDVAGAEGESLEKRRTEKGVVEDIELEEAEGDDTSTNNGEEDKEKKRGGLLFKVAQQNMEAELKRLEDQEAVLRKQRILGVFGEAAATKHKGW